MSRHIEDYIPYVREAKELRTAQPIVAESTLAVTGAITATGGIVGTITGVAQVLASSGNTTLTQAMSGSTMLFDSAAGITYSLPTTLIVGTRYRFLWTVAQSSSNHIITAGAGKFLVGGCIMASGENVTPSATLGPKAFAANGSSHIQYTSNDTTTGSGLGTWLEFVAVTTGLWGVYGVVNSPSGSIATPFST